MKELYQTLEALRALDTNYDLIMQFLALPDKHFEIVDNTLRHHIAKLFNDSEPVSALMAKHDQALNLLHDRWWGNCYPLHDSHFHKNFIDYCNCPFTCLTEITDCIEKCLEGKQ